MFYPCIEFLTAFKEFSDLDKQENLRPIFKEISMHEPSDIFFQVNKPILVKISGDIFALNEQLISSDQIKKLAKVISGGNDGIVAKLLSGRAVNSIYRVNVSDNIHDNRYQNLQKYRVNMSSTMLNGESTFQIVLRTIPDTPPKFSDLGICEDYIKLCCPHRGIVVIAGETGSGKSTTMASKVRYILEGDTPIKGNIIEHAEPIEYTYELIDSKHSFVNQSQIPENFETFNDANREAMRRKPALIIIGELRDTKTIESAVKSTLTGHPVYATVHAGSVASIVQRMVSEFPLDERSTALFNIVSTLEVMVAQRLVKKTNGKQMAVREFLRLTNEIRSELLQLRSEQDVTNSITRILESEAYVESGNASPLFSKQGKSLYEEGIITKEAYLSLL